MQKFWNVLIGAAGVSAAAVLLSLSPAAVSAETTSPVSVATGTTATEPATAPGWHKLADGRFMYYDTDGNPVSGVQEIDGVFYHFSTDGILKTGWQTIAKKDFYFDPKTGNAKFGWLDWNGNRYYIDEAQGKRTGWVSLQEGESLNRYYFDGNGILQTGFFRVTENGDLYYAQADGSICANGIYTLPDGYDYWFYEDGTLHTGWQTVNGIRRYYDPATGQAVTGWINWNHRHYYVSKESGKCTGSQEIDGVFYPLSEETGAVMTGLYTLPDGTVRYYLEDGSYAKGFVEDGDYTYYFDENGSMVTGWTELDSKVYYFAANGNMAVGFTKIEDDTYYFDETGVQLFGLQQIGGKLYCFQTDNGRMESGWITLDQNTYYFQEDGSARTGWLEENSKHYYFGQDGIRRTGWQTIDGKRYCFLADGSAVTGWQTDANGSRYYFSESGAALTGWQKIGNASYYFLENGAAASGITQIGNAKYYFDPSTCILLRSQTKNGVTVNQNGVITKVQLTTEYLNQTSFPTGCESVSATILLRQAGYNTSVATFVDSALEKGNLYTKNGVLYGPDPNKVFVGDPRSSNSFGCFAPVITNALNKLLKNGDQAKTILNTPISKLITDYIDKGTPIAIWATIRMMVPDNGRQWVIPETGKTYTWKRHEHCLILVGYDDQYYYFNDPYQSGGLKAYARSVVEARYAAMGSQAVVIERK